MALNYAKLFNRRVTPQSQSIPGVVGFDTSVPAVIADFVRSGDS